jgi:hypothetical protein
MSLSRAGTRYSAEFGTSGQEGSEPCSRCRSIAEVSGGSSSGHRVLRLWLERLTRDRIGGLGSRKVIHLGGLVAAALGLLETVDYGPSVTLNDQLRHLLIELAKHIRGLCHRLDPESEPMDKFGSILGRLRQDFEVGVYILITTTLQP